MTKNGLHIIRMYKKSWQKIVQAAETIVKPELTNYKGTLSVWWDWKDIIRVELLRLDKTIDTDFNCQQVMRLIQ